MACNKAPAEDDELSPTPMTDVVLPLGDRMLKPRRLSAIPSTLRCAATDGSRGASNCSLGCDNSDLDNPSLGFGNADDLDDSGAGLPTLRGIFITSWMALLLGWREDGADDGGVDRTDLVSARLTGLSIPPLAFAVPDGAPLDRIVSVDSQRSTSFRADSCLAAQAAFVSCGAEAEC